MGQEFADPAETNIRVEERMNQVESLVDQLVQQRSTRHASPRNQLIIGDERENDISREDNLVPATKWGIGGNAKSPLPFLLATTPRNSLQSQSLSSRLLAVLPHPPKAALILNRGKFFSLPIHARGQLSRKIASSVTNAEQLTKVSEPLSPMAHPVLFARKLIQLALCLHQLDPPIYDDAKRYVEVASRCVTSQDFLMDSIDGIETLMFESCYYINMGNIHRAWLVLRRALAIAQLIGLSEQTEEPDSREENVWFRLILADRSISWMLGLPHAITDNTFAGDHELGANAWTTKLERIHAVVFGRIITRNLCMQRRSRRFKKSEDGQYDDGKVTQDIDQELKLAAQSLPIEWWTFPTLKNESKQVDIIETVGRLIAQMHHYFLLIILFQPYLVRKFCSSPTSDGTGPIPAPLDDAYSQITVLSASREALLRFLVLRSFHRTLSYRGVDDKAFVACIMFLLIHMCGHSCGRVNLFEHQRPRDRGIVKEVISILEQTSSRNKDALSASLVHVLKRLVEIETHSADREDFLIWLERSPNRKSDYVIEENNNGLKIPMPYLGLIRIARREPNNLPSPTNLGQDSMFPAKPTPDIPTAARDHETGNSLVDQDLINVPLTSDFQIQDAAYNHEGLDFDEYFDLSSPRDFPMTDTFQSSTHMVQGVPRYYQAANSQKFLDQEANPALLGSWLEYGTLSEANLVATEMSTIDG